MIAGSNCNCLVCRLEKGLVAEFRECKTREDGPLSNDSSGALSRFPTYLDLVHHLHGTHEPNHSSFADVLLLELLKRDSSTRLPSVYQRLLLLVFIPTIHRTASQVGGTFPSLARDDVSQQVVSVFLEFLQSAELRTRRSHLAFTIARKLRRSAFRWAIRESRGAASEEPDENPTSRAEPASEGAFPAERALYEFLDSCEEHGWLSLEERHLLIQFKIEGISCQELACRNGHSAVAIRHRIQRLLDRLRRLARAARQDFPRQLELFPR